MPVALPSLLLGEEVPDEYTERSRVLRGFRLKVLHHPTDDIRVHAGAR